MEDILIENHLIDIWRIRHPTESQFTWRQKTPPISRRLDYWFISNDLQEDVDSVDITTAFRSGHSAITLAINITGSMKARGVQGFGNLTPR